MVETVLYSIIGYSIHILLAGTAGTVGNGSTDENLPQQTIEFSLRNFFFQGGIGIFAFEGIGLVFTVKSSMKSENLFHIVVKVVGIVMII